MIIDTSWFGYGAGLVLIGWFCGLVVNILFTSLRGVR